MKNETNSELQNQVIAALSEFSPQWWGKPGQPVSRIYFDAGVMTGIKVWIEFADAATLAGAAIKARWTGGAQHQNWIAKTEAQWAGKFEAALEAIAALRDEAGLSEEQNQAEVEEKNEKEALLEAVAHECVELDRLDAANETALIRAAATTLPEIVNAAGQVDLTAPLKNELFAQVRFGAGLLWWNAQKAQRPLKAWHAAAKKAAACAPALMGFAVVQKRGGKGGRHTWSETVAVIDGVVCLAADAAKIQQAVAAVEAEALAAWNDSPAAAEAAAKEIVLSAGEKLNVFQAGQPGFSLMPVGQSRASSNGTVWTCRAAGPSWYVATGVKAEVLA